MTDREKFLESASHLREADKLLCEITDDDAGVDALSCRQIAGRLEALASVSMLPQTEAVQAAHHRLASILTGTWKMEWSAWRNVGVTGLSRDEVEWQVWHADSSTRTVSESLEDCVTQAIAAHDQRTVRAATGGCARGAVDA